MPDYEVTLTRRVSVTLILADCPNEQEALNNYSNYVAGEWVANDVEDYFPHSVREIKLVAP